MTVTTFNCSVIVKTFNCSVINCTVNCDIPNDVNETTEVMTFNTCTSVINCTVNCDITNDANETMTMVASLLEVTPASYVILSALITGIVLSIVILVTIKREGTDSFFQWKIFDRFTVYNVFCDFVLSISVLILVVHIRLKESFPEGVMCMLVGMAISLFSISQALITTITAIFVYTLVVHNHHLTLGKCDWILYLVAFGIPLLLLITLVVLNESRHNLGYCNLIEDTGFEAWNFGLTSAVLIASFFAIAVLYCVLFGRVGWRRRQATNTLQNSAVNTTRLAIKLSVYVIAHFSQFIMSATEAMFHDPPIEIYRVVAICSSLGGVFNAVVYFTVRKRRSN